MRVMPAIVLLLASATTGIGGQSPAPPLDAVLAGRVVDSGGFPVEGAVVSLTGAGPGLSTDTNPGGQFTFTRAGSFEGVRLSVTKAGFLSGFPGQLGPQDLVAIGSHFDVAAGRRLDTVVIKLWAEGAISGRITDRHDAPVVGAAVNALTRVYTGVGTRWQRAKSVSSRTGDRGTYRFDKLPPGDYVIVVRPLAAPGMDAHSVPPIYYPASRSAASGGVVTLAEGDTRSADIVVEPAPGTGLLSGPLSGTDRSLAGVTVRLAPLNLGEMMTEFDEIASVTDSDGQFHFTGIPEGEYRLTACQFPEGGRFFSVGGDFERVVTQITGGGILPDGPFAIPPLPDAPTLVADQPVSVDAQRDTTIVVPMRMGARVNGRVVFDGAKPKPSAEDLLTVPVMFRHADGGSWGSDSLPVVFPQPRIEADGRFRSAGLPPDDYVLNVSPWSRSSGLDRLREWSTASITVGGHEMLGAAIGVMTSDIDDVVVTLTDKLTAISGAVRDTRGNPTGEARVIVFPRKAEDRNQYMAFPAPRRVLQVRVDKDGHFQTPLPPGEYLVAAVTSVPPLWMTPDHLQSIVPQAVAVKVAVGDQPSLSVIAR